MRARVSRRRFLRGALSGGAAVTVGLPLLDVFLNGNGDALASGAPLPRRFGTWFWGCGSNAQRWVPEAEGTDFQLPPELEPLAGVREHLSILSGFSVFLAREPNLVHYTGCVGTLTGEAPDASSPSMLPTLDVLVADEIGGATRFRSLEMVATGNPKHTLSQRNQNVRNLGEGTALSAYQRVFGSGFVDPNAADWAADPTVLLRQSALSVVREDRKRLEAGLGAADRARLDEYFTSLRQIEKQLELQGSKPPPLDACRVPEAPDAAAVTLEVESVIENHRLMAEVLALALACDQTRVFNVVFSSPASSLHTAGGGATHHALTHEESFDPELGYQKEATTFVIRSMEAFATLVAALQAIPEGDGTLLDNCLVLAHTDTSHANTHSVDAIPVMFAGQGGGRVRPGVHVRGVGDSTARIGLTALQAMGLKARSFGVRQNEATQPISAVLV